MNEAKRKVRMTWETVLQYLDDLFIERPSDDYDRGYNWAIRTITRFIQKQVANEVRPEVRDEKVWREVVVTVAMSVNCTSCELKENCSAIQGAGGNCVETWNEWLAERLWPEKADELIREEGEAGDD